MNAKQMNNALQALNLLDHIVSTIGSRQLAEGGRTAHVQYQQAVTTIREALTQQQDPQQTEETNEQPNEPTK